MRYHLGIQHEEHTWSKVRLTRICQVTNTVVLQWTSVHESIVSIFNSSYLVNPGLSSDSGQNIWKSNIMLWFGSNRSQSSRATLVLRVMTSLKIEGQALDINTTEALQRIFTIVSSHYFLYSPGGVCDSRAKANCWMLRCLRIQTGNLDLSCDLNQTTELNIPVHRLAWLGLHTGKAGKSLLSTLFIGVLPLLLGPFHISPCPERSSLINPAHTPINLLSSPSALLLGHNSTPLASILLHRPY